MCIIYFDPGESTGYAITDNLGNLQRVGTLGNTTFNSELISLLSTLPEKPKLVIIESFQLYPWKAKNKSWSSFPEVEHIGAIKLYCHMNNIRWLEQKPAQKDTFNNDLISYLLMEDDVDLDTATKHTYDAIRHMLVYFTTKNKENTDGYQNITRKIKIYLQRR